MSCIAEHWLDSMGAANIAVPGFNVASWFTRTNNNRGRTAIFVMRNIKFHIYDKIPLVANDVVFEVTAILLLDIKPIIVSFYRSPTANFSDLFNEL